MKLDFNLNDLVEIWMHRLMPVVKQNNVLEPLIDKYERVSNNLIFGRNEEEASQRKEYREKLLGPDLIAGVPPEYTDLSIIDKVGYGAWQFMDLSERAKWIAYYRIENMTELVREHLRLQKQQEEELINKLKSKNKRS